MCDPCRRAVAVSHPALPHGFFNIPQIREMLASHEFGQLFLAVRAATGETQQQLGIRCGLSAGRVSDVERGQHHLRFSEVIARVAAGLDVPPGLISLGRSQSWSESTVDSDQDWAERGDYIAIVTAAATGSRLYPELERLDALLPVRAEPVRRLHIGNADVAAIEVITDGFRRSDFASGGGVCRAAAIAQLHQVRQLEKASCTDTVRTRLLMATADLAMMVGWMSYDVDEHGAARRAWAFALKTAWRARSHERSTDLAVDVLLDAAHQALHRRRPKEALRLVQLAENTAADREQPISAITQSYISVSLGWCRAALGQAQPCRRAMGEALDALAAADPATTPSWAWHVNDAEIAAQQGHALFLLAQTQPRFAASAVDQLHHAVNRYGEPFARSRAVNQASLAAAHFYAGDIDAAVATGVAAVSAISRLNSPRAFARLQPIVEAAGPFRRRSEVAGLCESIRAARSGAAS
jgi:transcriptional regulator with XRE-family HTH domain